MKNNFSRLVLLSLWVVLLIMFGFGSDKIEMNEVEPFFMGVSFGVILVFWSYFISGLDVE